MTHVLLLNATYEPLRVITWQRAIRLLTLGKVEVIEETDREIRSVSFVIRLPSVVRLLRLIRPRRQPIKFSRQNIYLRDNFRCQYCGARVTSQDLNLDHVIPRALGGKTTWENIVTCCIPCNVQKGGNTPEAVGLRLIQRPVKPDRLPGFAITINLQNAPDSWRDYLYWNVELET
jgi:5-methylcytosine-specific restriction endonuclease McrA